MLACLKKLDATVQSLNPKILNEVHPPSTFIAGDLSEDLSSDKVKFETKFPLKDPVQNLI